MQFQARLAQVNGTVSRKADAPKVVQVKLEPLMVTELDWLFEHLGRHVVVELRLALLPLLPMEEAIEEAYQEPVAIPAAGRRRNGTRSSEQT
jgi:hypothetical protein